VTGSLSAGVLAAVLMGAAMSLIMVFMDATLKVEQIVTGMALNLLASGLSLFWFKAGVKSSLTGVSKVATFQAQPLPLLGDLPYLGEVLFSHEWPTYFAFLMVPAIGFFLYRTRFGLEIRCLGENPKAIDMKGLSVTARQYGAVLFGGAMAGLGGAFLTLGTTGRFVPEISAGRGWLAIVVVIAGGWRVTGVLIAALAFAFLDAFQLQLQGIGVRVPYQILLALPFVVAIVALALRRGVARPPAALGIPYHRE